MSSVASPANISPVGAASVNTGLEPASLEPLSGAGDSASPATEASPIAASASLAGPPERDASWGPPQAIIANPSMPQDITVGRSLAVLVSIGVKRSENGKGNRAKAARSIQVEVHRGESAALFRVR